MTVEATYSAEEVSEDALKADYTDSITVEIPIEDCTFTPETFTSAGTQNVTVSYTYNDVTKSDTVEVTVNESGNTPSDNPGQQSSDNTSGTSTSTSKTGDITPIALLAVFVVISATAFIVLRKKIQ